MANGEVKFGAFTLGMVQTNCYYVYREGDGKETPCIVIDPGDLGSRVHEELAKRGLKTALILLTHAHFDHILGVDELRKLSGAEVWGSEEEKELFDDPSLNCSSDIGRPCTVKIDRYLKDLETFEAAGLTLQTISTPGHTKGSCCFYIKEANLLFSGDTLFAESVGRTDLPTGSMSAQVRSIKEKLFALPDDTLVLSGHTGETTIGHEKKYNPFL
ncbi:MAG: MBL fold metallo-hydrolase [Lachnospiraceae bacterium]|nr:MBL fold metallo-hydrolase [Lachnospiraceae bacterium]